MTARAPEPGDECCPNGRCPICNCDDDLPHDSDCECDDCEDARADFDADRRLNEEREDAP